MKIRAIHRIMKNRIVFRIPGRIAFRLRALEKKIIIPIIRKKVPSRIKDPILIPDFICPRAMNGSRRRIRKKTDRQEHQAQEQKCNQFHRYVQTVKIAVSRLIMEYQGFSHVILSKGLSGPQGRRMPCSSSCSNSCDG